MNFDYPADKMQIIIGDDSKDPEVSAKIDQYAAANYPRIEITRRGDNIGFKPGNLNHMLKYTKGEFIAIFDSDFLPKPDYLRRVMNEFDEHPELADVQTRWRIANLDQNFFSILGGTISHVTHYIALPFMKCFGGNGMIGGSAHVIRKSDLEEIGGWRAGTLTEDIEASCELILRGKKIIYLEDVIVDCEAPFTLKDLCKQQMRWAFGNITAFKRNMKPILKSPDIKKEDKWNVVIFALGYLYPFLLVFQLVIGMSSVFLLFKAYPGYPLSLFFLGTFINFLISSGSFISNVMVLFAMGEKKLILRMILGTIFIGPIMLFYINKGIYQALFNKNMEWFILEKQGNEAAIQEMPVEVKN